MRKKLLPFYLFSIIFFGAPLLFVSTYLIAAFKGHLPWCVPFLSKDVYITLTGMNPPESYLFRGGLIPIATIISIVFYFLKKHLRLIGVSKIISWVIFALGLLSGIFLIISTSLMQGEQTPVGIHVFFASSFFLLSIILEFVFLYEDVKHGKKEDHKSLEVRVILSVIVLVLLAFASFLHEIGYAWFEWIMTFCVICWYGTFLLNKDVVYEDV